MDELRYGINPHQRFHAAEALRGSAPVRVLNGKTSFINWLDALNAWQLVREARAATGLPAAASFKHVSPAGAALAVPLSPGLARSYEAEGLDLSPAATAYVRARGADPKCSFGDFAALSEELDLETARVLRGVVSDGVIAPGFAPGALEILKQKKRGAFIVMQADADFEPPERESREVFGMRLVQDRNARIPAESDLSQVVCGALSPEAKRDLLLGLAAIKFTQSNSMGLVLGGQTIGIGAGQQSRVDCTRLAAGKADLWRLRSHPKALGLRFRSEVKRQERINWRVRYLEGDLDSGEARALAAALEEPAEPLGLEERRAWLAREEDIALVSDAFIPFRDNIDLAARHGVRFVAEHGGSARSGEIESACREHGIALVRTGLRLFHH
ncbi:MAG: phosphoribosylaminoimidazolecarboxamide formyltransferase [Deltaproteobacteria bacterium]|nr:phosphoribosylaminoimidazolecarboxamide formyltransferase [Deltaproteobacteria bacterium]